MAVFAVQAQEVCYTLEPATGSNNSYAGNCDITIDGITWNLTGNSTMLPWRIGGKNLTGVDRALYSKTPIASAVNKVVLTTGTHNLSAVNGAKLLVAANADFSGAVEYSFTFAANSDIEIPVSAAAGSYYKFVFNVTAGNSNKYLQFTRAKFYAGGEGGDTPAVPTLTKPTFTPADGTAFDESLEVAIEAEEGATIYYTTNGDEPSTTSAFYTEPFSITETTTVKAYAVKDGSNDSQVATATYTKNVPVDPNAITETIVASETGVDNGVAVESLTFGNVTATFDKGTNSNPTRYYTSGTAFRAYGGNTITFTGDAGVTINSVVFEFGSSDGSNAITADCGTYSEGTWTGASNKVVFTIGGSTGNRRLAKITVVYSIQEGVVVISTPSIAGEETFLGSTTVEITNNADGTTLYYSTDGVDYKEYTVAFTIDATTTVYAYAQDGEGNKSSVAEATFTEMEIISIAEAKAAYDAASANVAVAVDITGAVVTVNSGQYMFIETAEAGINIYNSGADYAVGTKFTTGYILGESAVYGKMHQITNAEFCNVATETVEVTPEDVTIAELNADFDAYEGRYVKLTGVNINNKTITQGEDTYGLFNRFDFITAPAVAANCDIVAVVARYNTTYQVFPVSISNSVDVTAAGYATLYLGYPVAIPANVEAYVVSAVNDGWVALEQVTGVLPAEKGVIVKAGQGEYEFVYSAGEVAVINSSLLKGTVAAENVTPVGTAYVLSAPDSKVGLYQAALTEGAFLNNANKAYLDVTNSNGIASYSFNFDWNGTTGVEGVVAEGAQDGAIYDITGRRVKAITAPGIYIVNGKKVVK